MHIQRRERFSHRGAQRTGRCVETGPHALIRRVLGSASARETGSPQPHSPRAGGAPWLLSVLMWGAPRLRERAGCRRHGMGASLRPGSPGPSLPRSWLARAGGRAVAVGPVSWSCLCPPVFLTEFSWKVVGHLGPTLCLSLEVLTRLPSRRRRPPARHCAAECHPAGPSPSPTRAECCSRTWAFCSGRCIYFLTVHTDVPQSGQEAPLLRDAFAARPRVQTQPLTLPSDSLTSVSRDLCHRVCITFLDGIPCRSGTRTKSLAHKRFPWPVWGPPGVFPVGHVHLTPGARAA